MSRALIPLFAALLLLSGCSSSQPQPPAGFPAVPVRVARATQETVPVILSSVGKVEASTSVSVKSQVAGPLVAVRFTEGAVVNRNDLLFEIAPRPYQEALRQAEAALARDRAQLQQAQATLARDTALLKNAEASAERYNELNEAGVISREQYDQFRTNAEALQESIRADQAGIESARASVESNQAAVERAKLDLSYCQIRSPISGRAGNVLVHAGNLVRASDDNPLVVINQLTPIFVTFAVPEEHLGAIRENSRGQKLPVEALLQADSNKPVRGVLSVIDNAVDTSTGTIRLKAVFSNAEGLLWPGQFVNVALTLQTQRDAIVVPAEAVQPGQQGQMVYLVKPDQTVEPRPVTVGLTFGDKVVLEKGVAAGDTVVTDGQLRLFPGAKIQAIQPN